MPSSVSSSPDTACHEAPSAASRAASIACVSGITWATSCIQPGSVSSGTLAPQKRSSATENTFASTVVSRPRSPNAPQIRPSPVAENDATTRHATSSVHEPALIRTPKSTAPATSAKAATTKPFAITGSARPKYSASRFAGVESRYCSVW